MNEMDTYQLAEFYNIGLNTIKAMRLEGLPFERLHDKLFCYNYESVEGYLNIDGELYSEERILIKVSDVMDITGLNKNKIYRLVDSDELPCYKLKGTKGSVIYRFDEEEVDYWYREIYLKG